MSHASPHLLDVAARLVAFEMDGKESSGLDRPPAFHVCERLRPHLATLMGKAGFQAVLSRALAVVSAEVPWLLALRVNVDGALEGWNKQEAQVTPKKLVEGGVLLVAKLLGLLVAFIGENLTLRLVRDVWPNLSIQDSKFMQGEPL